MHLVSKKELEFCWNGNRDDIEKSDDGYNSRWWSADERWGHSLCRRVGYASALSSVGKLCDEHGYSYEWINGKTTSYWKRFSNTLQYGKLRTNRGSWFINEFFLKLAYYTTHDTFVTVYWSTSMTLSREEIDHPTSSSSSSILPTMTSSSVSSESVARWETGRFVWDRFPSRSCVK